MNPVIDPPKTVLPPQAEPSMPVEPEQGVIEEARRRQQRRWASIAVTFAALVVILIAARFASGAGARFVRGHHVVRQFANLRGELGFRSQGGKRF